MKKQYLRTIIGSSGRDYISWSHFNFMALMLEFFESNLSWVGQYDLIWFLVFAQIRHLRQNFDTCTWSRTAILW